MLLIVLSALLGAYLGSTRDSKVSAMLVSGVLAAAGHIVVAGLSTWMLGAAASQAQAQALLQFLGAWEPLWVPVSAAFGSAAIAGLLAAVGEAKPRGGLYLADDGQMKPERRKRKRRPVDERLGSGPPRAFGDLMNR